MLPLLAATGPWPQGSSPGSAASLHSTEPFLSHCPNTALVFLTSSQNKGLALSTARELCLHLLGFSVPCEHKHLPLVLPGWGYFCPEEHMALNSSASATSAWLCSSLNPQTEPGCGRHQGWHQPQLSQSPHPRGHLKPGVSAPNTPCPIQKAQPGASSKRVCRGRSWAMPDIRVPVCSMPASWMLALKISF